MTTTRDFATKQPAGTELPVFITSNQYKADQLVRLLGTPIRHHKIDLDEIQSLDLRQVVEHKVRQAYDIAQQPVLVEDVSLTFTAMGRLPGTFIKWFLEEIGNDGLCKLVDGLEHRRAEARIMYGLHDRKNVHVFEGKVLGIIAPQPCGTSGFGWNALFIPDGANNTYAEDLPTDPRLNYRAQAVEKLKQYLRSRAR